jgi:putative MATE family efflux protein
MFRDPTYFKNLFRIALPIIAQNFISSLLNMLDIAMIGQLGETAVASVGLANQVFFLLILMMFGINSGVGVFVAQLWGKGDKENIRKVQGIGLGMGLAASLLFSAIAILIPDKVLSIYSNDPQVIASGGAYLRIVGMSYTVTAITLSYSSVLRATGNVRVPVMVSVTAIILKTLLNYGLILGHFGLPAMGIMGAAIATVISRSVEVVGILLITYLRRLPPAARLHELVSGYNRLFLSIVLKTSLPVVINETLWSLGVTMYNIIYAHIGTESIAAVSIAGTIEGMAFVIFIGISEASGILIGNRIGASEEQKAFDYARRSLILSAAGAVLMGGVIFLLSDFVLGFYKISDVARSNAHNILMVMSLMMWVKVTNMIIIVGILRSGGDTRFSMWVDAGSVWLVGVPLAWAGANLYHLPIYGVYLLVVCEELVKFFVVLWRFISRRWMVNLAHAVS